MKKASSGLLAALMALSLGLAACSGGGGTPTAEPGKGDGGAAGGKEVNLTMTSWRVEDVDGYKKIIEAFEKENPGIKISFKPQKATEYNTILNTALQSDSAADIIQLRPYATGVAIADGGYLEPLDGVKGLDAIPKEALDAARAKDGKVYGVPLSLNSTQIYYNKKIFADNGLQEPKSWDELIALAKALKEKNITPFAFGAKEGWLLSLSHGIIAPGAYNGNAFIEKMLKGEADMQSPEYKTSIQRMKELAAYFPDNFVGLDLNDTRALFATEKAAMFMNGSFELEVIQKMNPNMQIDFFPMPTDDGKQVITTWVDGSYAVNTKSPHKAEAMKFMEFMATPKFGELFANTFKRISAIPGVKVDDPLVNKMADLSSTISTPYAVLVHFGGGDPSTKKVMENALQGMYLDKMTPEQVSDELQKSLQSWFKPSK
ncbi:MAG: ABC transporter substrate-binding protein [Clostridia bacterium]